ncbi:V-set and immunoglobulin domain-containing protein 10-like 2 [Electrophorus electricus]|uniref:V-set and immunoglobulin domain-containing protein 10-like 2 n=1 Tax=Electrophorus electricus TaxID=8005 RepID=UPI0015D09405|nr:V-set and immunoglobulin domain-containing protein 10-like 2 [Electrophorus electricus]
MHCSPENGTGPIQYTWEHESRNGLVTTLAESNSSLLNITWVTRNHTGWYRCLARNEVNQQCSNQIWLDVLFGPDLPHIDVTAYSITENGYSALEKGNVSLMCQASSNPPSQYIWFYNNSEIYSGPELTITKILRMHTGKYGCTAKNTFLNTCSKKTITLTIYYPPDGNPSCSIHPVNNYTDLALSCSWVGGYPPATLNWSPHNNEYLMLSCSWEGGFPLALLWWVSRSGDMQGTSEENSNILLLPSSGNYSDKAFVCQAKHPLAKESKQCVLNLDAPVLMTQSNTVSVFEGTDVQLTCFLAKHYPPVSGVIWYNNIRKNVGYIPKKYILQQSAAWYNLTVRETDIMVDSGQYWCSAANAVGGTEIPIMLLVMRYPMPPNVTISKITYSSSQRTNVNVEWLIQTDGDITGFFIESQTLPAPVGRSDIVSLWQKVAVDLEPSTRSYQANNLDPTGKYAFRITAINHRTLGYPSEIKSPVPVAVSKPYFLVSESSPVEATTVWMRCDLKNGTGPIQYTWEQESRSGLVTTLAESNSSLLNITFVTRNHTGWYRCLARNEVNQQCSEQIWLDVLYGPDLPQLDTTAYSVTENGYSALEKGNVSLICHASSNPPSRYIWLYNNSEIFSGPQLTIIRIMRMHTGNYDCLAENDNLNTRTKKTITLTVYYPPEGAPSCTMFPVRNYTDLAISCSWVGGFPPPTLKWTPYENGDSTKEINITQIQPGPHTANNSVFICYGLPYGEAKCSANSSSNYEYLMLSCSWEGGFPRALLWWVSSSGNMQGTSEENSNILVLHASANYSGKSFVCHAKHPLAKESSQCVIKLEAPVLTTRYSVVSVFEGNDVQLDCILSKHYPAVTEITWYNNKKQKVVDKPKKYYLQQAVGWSNLTVRETDGMVDSGQYWCSATNAVRRAEIPIMLLVISEFTTN